MTTLTILDETADQLQAAARSTAYIWPQVCTLVPRGPQGLGALKTQLEALLQAVTTCSASLRTAAELQRLNTRDLDPLTHANKIRRARGQVELKLLR